VSDLSREPISQLHQQLIAGKTTASELTRASLEAIERDNPGVGALVHVDAEYAMARAEQIDREG